MRRRNPKAGITQFELLISLAVMGFLAILFGNVLNFQRQTIDRFETREVFVGQMAERSRLYSFIEAIPVSLTLSEAQGFVGQSGSLSFSTLINDGVIWPGALAVISLSEEQGQIQFTITGFDWDQNQITTEATLGSGTDLRLRYYGIAAGNVEPIWHDQWTKTQTLPELIKITWYSETPMIPILAQPGLTHRQSVISLSSREPPR